MSAVVVEDVVSSANEGSDQKWPEVALSILLDDLVI